MDTKMDARGQGQSQFPASFPDTFKNFFELMNEDEDHCELFANLLEDKVIPRNSITMNAQRQRCGGSLRSHHVGRSNSHFQQAPSQRRQQILLQGGPPRSRSGSSGDMTLTMTMTMADGQSSSVVSPGNGHRFMEYTGGRSASYRLNRARRSSLSSSATGINRVGFCGLGSTSCSSSSSSLINVDDEPVHHVHSHHHHRRHHRCRSCSGSLHNCSHGLCTHSQPHSSERRSSTHLGSDVQQECSLDPTNANLSQQPLQQQQTQQQQMQQQQHQQQQQNLELDMQQQLQHLRLGPDGEDNSVGRLASNFIIPRRLSDSARDRPPPRHSIILERAFDFDTSCDESDIPSCSTPGPVPSPAPHQLAYNVLKPILKQPQPQPQQQQQLMQHQHLQQHHLQQQHLQHQQQMHPMQPQQYSPLPQHSQLPQPPPYSQLPQFPQHSQQIMPQHPSTSGYGHVHRLLPTPPTHGGLGAYHTRESALQRVQQQSGMGSHGNLYGNAPSGSSTSSMPPYGYNVQQPQQPHLAAGYNMPYNWEREQEQEWELEQEQEQEWTDEPSTSTQATRSSYGDYLNALPGSGPPGPGLAPGSSRPSMRAQMSPILNRRRSSTIAANSMLLQADPGHGRNSIAGAEDQQRGVHSNNTRQQQLPQLYSYSHDHDHAHVHDQAQDHAHKHKHNHNDRCTTICERLQSLAAKIRSTFHSTEMRSKLSSIATQNEFGIRAVERVCLAKSPLGRDGIESCTVLTFQQAMSGAVSPQYAAAGAVGGGGVAPNGQLPVNELDKCLLGSSSALAAVAEVTTTSGPDATDSPTADSSDYLGLSLSKAMISQQQQQQQQLQQLQQHQQQYSSQHRERGVGESAAGPSAGAGAIAQQLAAHGSTANFAAVQYGNRMAERQRLRTSSMPAEGRKPRLAETRRSAIHCGPDADVDYYRLRSFSITSHGVCNLGDSLRSRRSRSINSVTSAGTGNSHSAADRHNSNASGDIVEGDHSHASQQQAYNQQQQQQQQQQQPQQQQQQQQQQPSTSQSASTSTSQPPKATSQAAEVEIPAYKIAMLGGSGVGKTTLTYQFTTSDYICAYDLSLDDDYGRKTVSVLVDNIETDLEMIDHPACEMSTEAFCATYNIDLFVVVYSVVDRGTFKAAEKVLTYLKENDMLLTRGAILVGNKTDLERHREVSRQVGRKLAKEIACKFIETSSGLDHNVDELLVGIVAQVKLNPQRIRLLSDSERQRLNMQSTIQNHRHMHLPARRMVRQMSMCRSGDDDGSDEDLGMEPSTSAAARSQQVRRANRRALNLENILRMGESEMEDEDSSDSHRPRASGSTLSKFEQLAAGIRKRRARSNFNENGPSTSAAAAAARRHSSAALDGVLDYEDDDDDVDDDDADDDDDDDDSNGVTDCNRKVVTKLTTRTRIFLATVLRFKRNLKRRNSSSCSNLFVI
nr:AF4/FMR2 family member 4 [Drosophila virilis]